MVPQTHTGDQARDAWVRRWVEALADEYASRDVPWETAWSWGAADTAGLALESGWGRAEWNRNPGNITCGAYAGECFRNAGDGRAYRAYPSDDGFARDYVDLISTRSTYAPSWRIRAQCGSPVAWYAQLMRDGYHPYSERAERDYGTILVTVQRVAGPAPARPWGWLVALAGVVGVGAVVAWRRR